MHRNIRKPLVATQIIIFLVVAFAYLAGFFDFFDFRLKDMVYQRNHDISSEIVIVGIDDYSLSIYGKWPWNREIMAETINILQRGEPAVIGVDIIYSERASQEEDAALVAAVSGYRNTVFSCYGIFNQEKFEGTDSNELVLNNINKPFDELLEQTNLGIINVIPDDDGILRRSFIDLNAASVKYDGFSYAVYKKYMQSMKLPEIDKSEIPMDSYNRLLISYSSTPSVFSGATDGFEHLSIADIIDGEIDPEYFRDKIVLIGATSMGIPDDYYFTPIAPQSPMYGLEVHANIINQLLSERFLEEVPVFKQLIILFVILLFMICIDIFVGIDYGALASAALMAINAAGIFILYRRNLTFSFMYPFMLIFMEYLAILFFRLIYTNKDKKRIRELFGRYMSPKIIEQLVGEDIEELKLCGRLENITALFVDIRGFTAMSESMPPEITVAILNAYLKSCSMAVLEYGGTLDKYVGDCVVAFYNAPVKMENPELMAIKSAILMREREDALNKELTEKYGKTIGFGIGINSGEAIVGNIGWEFRMDYTVIGDTVNTASRLQGVADDKQILISAAVYDKVKNYVDVEFHGDLTVKGKQEPVSTYSVLGIKNTN